MTEKAISTLTYFQTSKEGIAKFVNQVITELEAGQINPLDLAIYIKSIEKSLEGIKERAKDMMLNEADKYSEKSIEYKGAKIEKSELGTKYDYSQCNDKHWNELNEKINAFSEEKKSVERFLKSLTETITIVDESTGETWQVHPPIKSSTTGLKVTIK